MKPQPDDFEEEVLEQNPNHPDIVRSPDIVAILGSPELFEQVLDPKNSELLTTLIMRLEERSWQEIADYLGERVSNTKFRWYAFLERINQRRD